MRQTSEYEQITPADELADSVREGVEEEVISSRYVRVRKSDASDHGRNRQVL